MRARLPWVPARMGASSQAVQREDWPSTGDCEGCGAEEDEEVGPEGEAVYACCGRGPFQRLMEVGGREGLRSVELGGGGH